MSIYPQAERKFMLTGHYSPGIPLTSRKLIVLHITTGPTDMGHQGEPHAMSAIYTFAHPSSQASAHFVIDRDGTVFQLVDCNNTAWHATRINFESIGIETSASADGKYPATDAQYTSLAALVKWLTSQMCIDISAATVRGHNDAAPWDGHTKCCRGGLDPERVIKLAQELG